MTLFAVYHTYKNNTGNSHISLYSSNTDLRHALLEDLFGIVDVGVGSIPSVHVLLLVYFPVELVTNTSEVYHTLHS